MFTYTPGIHGFKVMNDSTHDALQALWDSHPSHPALMQSFVCTKSRNHIHGAGIELIMPKEDRSAYDYTPLKNINCPVDRNALRDAVFEVMSDQWLQEFPHCFQSKTYSLDTRYDLLSLLIMPGCVFLHFPIWDEACTDMIKDDMCDDHFDMWNLGIFAAGPTKTAHEQIQAMGYVEKARPMWSMFIANVNDYEHSNVRIFDPAIHPGREGYEDD